MEADTTPTLLGGVGRIVQIDKSGMVKAKYNRGHQLMAPFGGFLTYMILLTKWGISL